jgi:hypothetical protein
VHQCTAVQEHWDDAKAALLASNDASGTMHSRCTAITTKTLVATRIMRAFLQRGDMQSALDIFHATPACHNTSMFLLSVRSLLALDDWPQACKQLCQVLRSNAEEEADEVAATLAAVALVLLRVCLFGGVNKDSLLQKSALLSSSQVRGWPLAAQVCPQRRRSSKSSVKAAVSV